MTLEQLIDACGGYFGKLVQLSQGAEYRFGCQDYWCEKEFYGTTPAEAVQKLYDWIKENNLIE